MTERTMLISAISNAGDRYGYGENGLIALMNESGTTNTQDVTDEQLSAFVRRHGVVVDGLRSCENCGKARCRNSIFAFHWDECVETKFQKNWKPMLKEG